MINNKLKHLSRNYSNITGVPINESIENISDAFIIDKLNYPIKNFLKKKRQKGKIELLTSITLIIDDLLSYLLQEEKKEVLFVLNNKQTIYQINPQTIKEYSRLERKFNEPRTKRLS